MNLEHPFGPSVVTTWFDDPLDGFGFPRDYRIVGDDPEFRDTCSGATTMWNGGTPMKASGMNSLTYSPFTLVSEFFYGIVAGIQGTMSGVVNALAPPTTTMIVNREYSDLM